MDDQKDDTQTADTPAPNPPTTNGQIMDVTAPGKQPDASGTSFEPEIPATDTAVGEVVDAPAEPIDTPQETTPSSEEEPSTEFSEPQPAPLPDSAGSELTPEPTPEPATTSISVTDMDATGSMPDAMAPEPASDPSSPDAEQQVSPPPHVVAKGGAPVLAIVVALIVAVGLAGLVIFTYLKNKNSNYTSDNASSSQTVVTKPQASASDVDTANQEIDNSLQKTDDNKDFSPDELSDTSLGL